MREIECDAGNGRVLSYLAAHAEIYRQQFTTTASPSTATCRVTFCTTFRVRMYRFVFSTATDSSCQASLPGPNSDY